MLGDVFEYPSQPGYDAVRPGSAYIQSSPGAFGMNSSGNPFLGSNPGQQPANPLYVFEFHLLSPVIKLHLNSIAQRPSTSAKSVPHEQRRNVAFRPACAGYC